MKVTTSTYWDNPQYFEWESEALLGEEKVKELEEKYHCDYPSYRDMYDAVLNWIKENDYKYSGTAHQNCETTVPVIDDIWLFQVSSRTWGGLMAEAHPDITGENERKGYLWWAWSLPEGVKEKLPNDC